MGKARRRGEHLHGASCSPSRCAYRPATLLALEDNQSSANALESTRTTILKNYSRDARLARRCMEVFPPLFRRTKPLTLPDDAPYSDADEEEAF